MPETFTINSDGIPTIVKDPDAKLDYIFDWTTWLDAIPDTIQSHVVTVDSGITKESDTLAGKKVTVWLSGGTVGEAYKVSCRITTANNPTRIEERTMIIKVVNR